MPHGKTIVWLFRWFQILHAQFPLDFLTPSLLRFRVFPNFVGIMDDPHPPFCVDVKCGSPSIAVAASLLSCNNLLSLFLSASHHMRWISFSAPTRAIAIICSKLILHEFWPFTLLLPKRQFFWGKSFEKLI